MASIESKPLTYFVSYSRADEGFALKLAEHLLAEGVNLWIDQINIELGNRWDRSIEEALETSQGLLILLSETSVESDNVMDEVSYALEEEKTVIPVLVEACEIPFRLRRLQYADLSVDFDKGLSVLLKHLTDADLAHKDLAHERSANADITVQSLGLEERDLEPQPPLANPQRNVSRKTSRKPLVYLGLGVIVLAATLFSTKDLWMPSSDQEVDNSSVEVSQPVPSPSQNPRELADTKIQEMKTALETSERLGNEALDETETISSQPWNSSKSDNEWLKIKELWIDAANQLAPFLPERPVSDQDAGANAGESSEPPQTTEQRSNRVERFVLNRLQPRHHEYTNRQRLTDATSAYKKSIYLANQPKSGSAAQCDPDTNFADSPAEWEPILTMREEALNHLKSVNSDVNFYPEQVLGAEQRYEEQRDWAERFYLRSPWYYAVQKAVCADGWSKQAQESDSKKDWENSVTLWERGIALLENAPETIPVEISEEQREKYRTAENNLELWKRNLQYARTQAAI